MAAPPVGQYASAYSSLPDGHGQTDPQNGAATIQNLNLPPLRGTNGQVHPQAQLQSQPQQPSPQPSGPQGQAAVAAAAAATMQYYLAPGQPFPMPGADPSQHLRYPIPPADSRIMSGGRHKKEIKRRTKTGCLTCRKRRIKCDEQHPACRNCQKSKRECLGYDPIFKPQPGPAVIQPALGASPINNNSATTPTYPSGYPGYPPSGSDHLKSESTEYSTAIDPALGGIMAHSGDGLGEGHRGMASDQIAFDVKRSLRLTIAPVKRTRIEDLFVLNGCPPPQLPAPTAIPEAMQKEMIQIYTTVYAPAIDKFLEVNWYASRGEKHFLANGPLCDLFMNLIPRFTVDPRDPGYPQYCAATMSLEASVIWALMGMCRTAAVAPALSSTEGEQTASDSSVKAEPAFDEEDVKEGVQFAVKRLEILEALLTGEYLAPDSVDDNPLLDHNTNNGGRDSGGARTNGNTPFSDQLKAREVSFWGLIHAFLTLRDDEAATAKEIDDAITAARGLLDSRENRDVIYSIVIARHLGNRLAEATPAGKDGGKPEQPQLQPENNDEEDAKTKLSVAIRFLEDEAGGKGTNQIVQRVSGMATRSWARR